MIFYYYLNLIKLLPIKKKKKFLKLKKYYTKIKLKEQIIQRQTKKIIINNNKNILLNNLFIFNLNTLKGKYSSKYLPITSVWLFSLYLKNINYYYTRFNIQWLFLDAVNIVNKNLLKKVFRFFYKKKVCKFLFENDKIFFSWFLQIYQFKDPNKLILLLKKNLSETHLKKHMRRFYELNNFFRLLYRYLKKKKLLEGYSLFFKGKLGKKGSVRKRKLYMKCGRVSFTNKNLRVNYRTYIIWTITGVIGCNISLFF